MFENLSEYYYYYEILLYYILFEYMKFVFLCEVKIYISVSKFPSIFSFAQWALSNISEVNFI